MCGTPHVAHPVCVMPCCVARPVCVTPCCVARPMCGTPCVWHTLCVARPERSEGRDALITSLLNG